MSDKITEKSPGIQELGSLGVDFKRIEKPAKESEAQEILAQAFKEKKKILACGGGTHLGAGVLPESVDLVLDTTALNRILAFDPRNLNVAVLGGMSILAINDYLAGQEKGFFLPLDPPLPRRATIGGLYAANGSGPSRLRYGTVRDQALGVRGADARGQEVGFGGKTVKNVSGYDLTKFLIGSAGSFCLITSISFRVYPLPEASSFCDLQFDQAESVEKFLTALRASILLPSAVVITHSSVGLSAQGFRGVISFEGDGRAVERQNKDLLQMAGNFGGKGESRMGRESMMKAMQSAIDPAEGAQDLLAIKVSVPIGRGIRAMESIRKLDAGGALSLKASLLAGNGILFLNAQPSNPDAAVRLISGLKEVVQAAEGYMTPVRVHRTLLSQWGERVNSTLHRSVLQPIKDKVDPTGVFPPVI